MKREFTHYLLLAKRLGISMLLFSVCRLIYLIYNYPFFSAYKASEIAPVFFYGLRFDISSVLYLNALIYILHIVPFNFRNNKGYQQFLLILFVIFNTVALVFELGDAANYRYGHKRLTSDFFGVLNDFNDQLFSYLSAFWYLLIIAALVIYGIARLYRYVSGFKSYGRQKFWIQLLLFIPAAGLFVVGARGGFQLRPITPITAMQYTDGPLCPLVYSTCFSLGSSLQSRHLNEEKYFADDDSLKKYYNLNRHYYNSALPTNKMNVVVIILESFSRYFVQSLSKEAVTYTPFLDSLINSGQCYVPEHAYADARHSHEGNTAVLTSIPALMNDPFITSIYESNTFSGYGRVLKNNGYTNAFFHGAKNGSMMLDALSSGSGIENYFGMDQYPNPKDYDGNWGIFDDKFFPFCADKIKGLKQPFSATIFNLSSHFPYVLPEEFKPMFPADNTKDPILPVIRYSDYVLKKFFETLRNEPWYNNTLFVFSADHAYADLSNNNALLNRFSIPIFFYCPGDTSIKKRLDFPVQQVDIMASILDYINVPDSFKCFGNSIFSPNAPHYAFSYEQGLYHIVEDSAMLEFNGTQATAFYDLTTDPLQKNNIIKTPDARIEKLTQRIKAVIQTYNHAMIRNEIR